MPIPEKIKNILTNKIIKTLNEKGLIPSQFQDKELQSVIGEIITEDLDESNFEKEFLIESESPRRAARQNVAQIKEQLAEQKLLNRKFEIEKEKIKNKGQLLEDSLTDSFKKQLDKEKITLVDKIKAYENKNKEYEQELQELQEINKDKTKIPELKKELQKVQELLASEKQIQERLLAEKTNLEQELKKAQTNFKDSLEEKALKDSLEEKAGSNLIKESIEKIKDYRDKNSKLEEKLSLLSEKFEKEIKNVSQKEDKDLEKEIDKFKEEINKLQNKLETVQTEKEELNKHKEELLALQSQENLNQIDDGQDTKEIIDDLKFQEEQDKSFKIINEINNESFRIYKAALNSADSYVNRIKKLDIFIKKTKEHLDKLTSDNKDVDSPENYSIQVLEYFSDQIKKKEAIKKLLTEQRQVSKDTDDEDKPVIIQKKVIKKHSAHGGSWKVAYADFVTAMMAFFLMLWLLSMLSQESRDNLKEYFKSYKAFKHSGQEVVKAMDSPRRSNKEEKKLNQKRMIEEFKKKFKGADEHLKVIEVPGGVRIQVMDIMDKPMFEIGSAKLKPEAKQIFQFLSERIKKLPGKLIIEGHTDGLKFPNKEKTNWELSMERASEARLQLVNNGVDQNRIIKIISYGFSEPINKEDYFDPRNRRINIIIQNIEEQMNIEEKTNTEGMAKASSH